MSIVLLGSTSGSCTLQEQAVAGTTTLTLPTFNGTVGLLVSGTAVASTSGTSIDFTGIPAGVRRITVMFNEVSQNSASQTLIVQIGSTTFTTSGYRSGVCYAGAGTLTGANPTAGFAVANQLGAATTLSGTMTITTLGSNVWVSSFAGATTSDPYCYTAGGALSLGATLDRVRITTVGGTATFDAGSINILYE